MANYPTADPSFTTKQDGVDYPQAAHINGIQDEVVAIGAALRGTLQHGLTVATGGVTVTAGGLTVSSGGATVSTGSVNIGGPSSLATLQVNGGSTFTGNVVMSGTLTVGGVAVAGAAQESARVTNTTFQNVAIGAWTGLSWNTELHDSNSLHSTASNSSRVALRSSGAWMVGANIVWHGASSGGASFVRLVANDSSNIAAVGAQLLENVGISSRAIQNVQSLYYATDTAAYVTVQVYQNSGSTRSVMGSTDWAAGVNDYGPSAFWAVKIG